MKPRSVSLFAAALAAGFCCAAVADDAPQPLPLKEVVLFSSGVGYFQREGQVQGNAVVPLSFREDQVNDVLKSLVLFDPQGQVRPVTYASPDSGLHSSGAGGRPISSSQTLGGLLREFQGARLRLEMGGEAIEGRLVSVSLKTVTLPAPNAFTQAEVLNVLTESGLRAVLLDGVNQVKVLDERLDRELRESLERQATGLDDQKKQVESRFAGAAARQVRAGYLQEAPVWKTSYRLVLGEKGAKEGPYLQGWAHVENQTEEDWKDVRLSLISGRPVSFIQDLYQALYVPRPVVQPQVLGSPVPQGYNETLEQGMPNAIADIMAYPQDNSLLVRKADESGGEKKVTILAQGQRLRSVIDQIFAGSGLQYAVDANVPNVPVTVNLRDVSLQSALRTVLKIASAQVPGLTQSRDGDAYLVKIRTQAATQLAAQEAVPEESSGVSGANLAKSVEAQAQGAERGALFQYAIKGTVTIPKGQAAMVPIVATGVQGQALSIFDAASDQKHALAGFKLKNSTGLHLSGGPVTVFRDGVYAGDAQIGHLSPGEDRLLSYAVDLDLVVEHDSPKLDQQTLTVTAKSGVLKITRKQQRENSYTFRNKGSESKTVLVQQPKETEFKLAEPEKPAETTAEEYRFLVPVAAGKTASLQTVVERPITEQVTLFGAPIDYLTSWAQNGQASEKLRGALKELVARRRKITDLQQQRAALDAELKSIDQEQARIRQNMAQLDRNNALYQQYVRKLTDQESRIEKLREETARLKEAEDAAQKEMREFTDGITAE